MKYQYLPYVFVYNCINPSSTTVSVTNKCGKIYVITHINDDLGPRDGEVIPSNTVLRAILTNIVFTAK